MPLAVSWALALLLAIGGFLVVGGSPIAAGAQGSWSQTEPPKVPDKSGSRAVRLDDGRVLVTGGRRGEGHTKTVELYDPETGQWSKGESMHFGRALHDVVKLDDGRVMVSGGSDTPPQIYNPKAEREVSDGDKERWSRVPPPPSGSLTLTSLGGPECGQEDAPAWCRTVLATGVNGQAAVFDPRAGENGAWLPTPPLPDLSTPTYARAVALDGKACDAGTAPEWCGAVLAAASQGTNAVGVYDPRAGDRERVGEWRVAEPFQVSRTQYTMTGLGNGDVLVAGGYTKTAEVFEPAADDDPSDGVWHPTNSEWRKTAELSTTRQWPEAVFVPDGDGDQRGQVLISGGKNLDTDLCGLASAELFDPTSDDGQAGNAEGAFHSAGNMNRPRWRTASVRIADTQVLVIGGRDNNCWDGSAELYRAGVSRSKRPDVELVAPQKGLRDGGEQVRVLGTGFTGATQVTFGRVRAPKVTVHSDGALTAVAPRQDAGTVPVRVKTPAGKSAADDPDAAFTYTERDGVWAPLGGFEAVPDSGGVEGAEMRNGSVLVLFKESGTSTSALGSRAVAMRYVPEADALQEAADPPNPPNAVASLKRGGVLAAGETGAAVYDPGQEAWHETQTPPTFSIGSSAKATRLGDGRVLVVDKGPSGRPASQVYDPESDRWRTTSEQPDDQFVNGATLTRLADGRAVLIGGGTNFLTAKVQVFDPGDGSWFQAANMPQERGGHAATLLADGRILASAGQGFGSGRGSDLFDPDAGTDGQWKPAAFTRNFRKQHGQTRLADGSVLSAGGQATAAHPTEDLGERLELTEVFDPERRIGDQGAWRPTASLNQARDGAGLVRLSKDCGDRCGHVVALGGSGISSVERYVPRPEVTDVSPASGVPGTEVTISGFGLAGVDEVTIAGQRVEFSVDLTAAGPDSPGEISATVPQGASPGQAPVTASTEVSTADGSTELPALEPATFSVTEPITGNGSGEEDEGDGTGGDDQEDDGPTVNPGEAVGRVTDLSAEGPSDHRIQLGWSAVADGAGGVASEYVVVQSRSPIDDATDFDTAFKLCGGVCDGFDPPPQTVGGPMTLTVGDLTPGSTYHYAIAPIGADGQRGPISASVSATTTGQAPAEGGGSEEPAAGGGDPPGGSASPGNGGPADGGVVRISGPSRITTALAASQEAFGEGQAPAAVLAHAGKFADALAGVPLAEAEDGPLLLTGSDELDSRVATELRRAVADGGRVYLLGGTAALSQQVTRQVAELGFEVVRLGGATRFETAATIAEQGLEAPERLLITTGTTFADAVAAGAAAAHTDAAVLLTAGERLPAATADYVTQHPPTSQYAIGGPAAAAASQITSLVGATRYETAAKVADEFFSDPATVGVATGTAFPDSLTGGAHVAGYGGPMLLSPPDRLHPAASDYLARHSSGPIAVLYGGTAALTQTVADGAKAAVAGSSPSP